MESNPQKFAILWNTIKNELSNASGDLIPVLISVVKSLLDAIKWFKSLSPEVQKLALMFVLFLAATGPVLRYFGALALLLGQTISLIGYMITGVGHLITAMAFLGRVGWGAIQLIWRGFLLLARAPGLFISGIKTLWGIIAAWVASWGAGQGAMALESGAAAGAIGAAYTGATGLVVAETWGMHSQWALASGMMALESGASATASAAAARSVLVAWVVTSNGIVYAWTLAMGRVLAIGQATSMALARQSGQVAIAQGAAASSGALAIGRGNAAALATTTATTAASASRWSKFKNVFGRIFSSLPGIVGSALKLIPRLFGGAFGVVRVAVMALAGVVGTALAAIAGFVGLPVWAVVAIIVAVLAAIGTALDRFYTGGVGGFIRDVGHAFAQLPRIIANVFNAIIRFIARAITVIRDWLSYLNPFARHSPSLVDNVTNGVSVILSQYARLKAIPGMLAGAKSALAQFEGATGPAADRLAAGELADKRKDVVSAAPQAGPAFDSLAREIAALRPQLRAIGEEVAAQQQTVDTWETSLNGANKALEEQERNLTRLQNAADLARDSLDAAEQTMQRLADTQLAGYGAVEDALFENEMAQKRLRLEIEKMGGSDAIQRTRDEMALLQGAIERLQATSTDLRLAGAGSEITGPIQEQIKAMQEARANMGAGANDAGVIEMQKQLDELQHQAEIMDLEKSLQFDPLQRQIDKVQRACRKCRSMSCTVKSLPVRVKSTTTGRLGSRPMRQCRTSRMLLTSTRLPGTP